MDIETYESLCSGTVEQFESKQVLKSKAEHTFSPYVSLLRDNHRLKC